MEVKYLADLSVPTLWMAPFYVFPIDQKSSKIILWPLFKGAVQHRDNLDWGEITDLNKLRRNSRAVFEVELLWLFTFRLFSFVSYFLLLDDKILQPSPFAVLLIAFSLNKIPIYCRWFLGRRSRWQLRRLRPKPTNHIAGNQNHIERRFIWSNFPILQ